MVISFARGHLQNPSAKNQAVRRLGKGTSPGRGKGLAESWHNPRRVGNVETPVE